MIARLPLGAAGAGPRACGPDGTAQAGEAPASAAMRRPLRQLTVVGCTLLALGLADATGALAVDANGSHTVAVFATRRPAARDPSGAAGDRWTIDVDLTRRVITVRKAGALRRRMRAAIGGTGFPTPQVDTRVIGRLVHPAGSPFGPVSLSIDAAPTRTYCAMPGRWCGISIQGTNSPATIGKAVTNGNLRVGNRSMRWLASHIPIGTPVHIHA